MRPGTLERLIGGVLLLAVAPVFLVVAVLIAFTGECPLFLQRRLGALGRPFVIVKLRTIPIAASHGVVVRRRPWQRRWAAALLPFLRRTHIDELPQLLNILRGEMSFIGPRPLLAQDYDRMPPWREARLAVSPGVTGLAQVSGDRALTAAQTCAVDLHYLRTRSLRLDVAILGRTFLCCLRGCRVQPDVLAAASAALPRPGAGMPGQLTRLGGRRHA